MRVTMDTAWKVHQKAQMCTEDMLLNTSSAAYLSFVIHTQPGSPSPSAAFHVMSSFLTSRAAAFWNSGLPTVSPPPESGDGVLDSWLLTPAVVQMRSANQHQCRPAVVDGDVSVCVKSPGLLARTLIHR